MFKKAFGLLVTLMALVAGMVACTDIPFDTLKARLDSEMYVVEYGQRVDYAVLNLPEGIDATITVGDESILQLDGSVVTAIKKGVTTLSATVGENTVTATVIVKSKNLAAPQVEVDKDIISWEPVENATTYIININSEVYEQTETTFDLKDFGTGNYTVNVCAWSSNTNFVASVFSVAEVQIVREALSKIQITQQPQNVSYIHGESFDKEGLEVTAVYNTGKTEVITDKVSFDKSELKASDSFVRVSYMGFDADIDVTVSAVINFETNGGSDVLAQTKLANESLTIPQTQKAGSTFVGWYCDSNFEVEFDGKVPAYSTTLFARWIDGDVIVVNQGESIQEAIDKAAQGATIFVKAGSFVEYITIEKSLTLLGNNYQRNANEERLPETNIYPAQNDDFNLISCKALISIYVPNVVIDGFTIDGDNPDLQNIWTAQQNDAMQSLDGLASTATDIMEIKELYNSKVGKDIGIDCGIGINVYRRNTTDESLDNVLILNNKVVNFSINGILMDNNNKKDEIPTENTRVEGNLFSGIIRYGLLDDNGDYLGAYGVALLPMCFNLKITNNVFKDNAAAIQFYGLYHYNQEASIDNNLFWNNSVNLWINTTGFGSRLVVKQNSFVLDSNKSSAPGMYNINSYGILLSGTENGLLEISDNTIDNFVFGILANGVRINTTIIERNTISNCDVAVAIETNFLKYSNQKSATYLTMRNDNVFVANQNDYNIEYEPIDTRRITIVDQDDNIVDIMAKGVISKAKVALSGTTQIRWAALTNAMGYKVIINGQDMNADIGEPVSNYYYYSLDLESEALSVYEIKVVALGLSEMESSESDLLSLIRVSIVDVSIQDSGTTSQLTKTVYTALGTKALSAFATSKKSGFAQDGWYTDETFADSVELTDILSESGTFYGKWLKTATYNYYDGSTKLAAVVQKYGDIVEPIEAPEKPGYRFVGWYTTKTFVTEYQFGEATCTANVNIYAKYVAE